MKKKITVEFSFSVDYSNPKIKENMENSLKEITTILKEDMFNEENCSFISDFKTNVNVEDVEDV